MGETTGNTLRRTRVRQGLLVSVADRAEDLAEAGLKHGQSWTLAQICEHLALGIENTVRDDGSTGPPERWRRLRPSQRLARSLVRRFMLLTGWFPAGASAPESVQPSADASLQDAIRRLRKAAESFDVKFADRSEGWGVHSMLGRMNGRAWRRFHCIHAAHHFSFLSRNEAKLVSSAG
jgi:hypothetical protein